MTTPTKPWAVLAYTVADDKGGGSALDAGARRELKAICDAANFGRMSVAAQVDFQRPKGVFRGSMTAPPPKSRGFSDVRAEDHPLWQQILGAVDLKATRLRVQHEPVDLSAARASVLEEFLRFGRSECPADRYVVSFYGHAYGPMGLFCDRVTGQRQKDTLRLGDLAGSMTAATGRASVTVFRDCFMSTLETVCQLQHATEFMVASQSLVPAEGVWPWRAFMAALHRRRDAVRGRAGAGAAARLLPRRSGQPRGLRDDAVYAAGSERGRRHHHGADGVDPGTAGGPARSGPLASVCGGARRRAHRHAGRCETHRAIRHCSTC